MSKIGVFSCGPRPLTKSIMTACDEVNKGRKLPYFIHHFENFGWNVPTDLWAGRSIRPFALMTLRFIIREQFLKIVFKFCNSTISSAEKTLFKGALWTVLRDIRLKQCHYFLSVEWNGVLIRDRCKMQVDCKKSDNWFYASHLAWCP